MTVDQALEQLGLDRPRNDTIHCPLHTDKTPSLHLYSDHYYCFSCGANGDGYGMIAAFTGQAIGAVLRSHGVVSGPTPMQRHEMERDLERQWFDMWKAWWNRLHELHSDAADSVLLERIVQWSDFYDRYREAILATDIPAERERILRQVERTLHDAEAYETTSSTAIARRVMRGVDNRRRKTPLVGSPIV